MTPERGIELVGEWPDNRSVPRKLAEGIKGATGLRKRQLKMLVEALYASAKTTADLELIERYFS